MGKRQIYRRIAEEVKQTVAILEIQTNHVPTNSQDTLKNTNSNIQNIYDESHIVRDSLLAVDIGEEITTNEVVLTTAPIDTYFCFNKDRQLLRGDDHLGNLQQWSLTNQVSHKAISEL